MNEPILFDLARNWLRDHQMPATITEYESLEVLLKGVDQRARKERSEVCAIAIAKYRADWVDSYVDEITQVCLDASEENTK